jgi:hypothetical protein
MIRIIGYLIPHNVIGAPGQFIAQRLDGNYSIAFSLFAVVETLTFRVRPYGKVGSFHVGPSKIFIAVLSVTLSFLFLIVPFTKLKTITISMS